MADAGSILAKLVLVSRVASALRTLSGSSDVLGGLPIPVGGMMPSVFIPKGFQKLAGG